MPLHLQVNLLRVLQDKEIQRVGSEKSLKIDVRIMAASNRDLRTEVKAKKFRDDLFYRLSVITLTVPPLRERRDDIPQLVANYMDYLRPLKSEAYDITDEALELFCKYSWPGNVRELMNVIERALLICDNNTITPADLPADMMDEKPLQPSLNPSEKISLELDVTPDEWFQMPLGDARREVLDKFEATYLTGLLKQTAGRIEKTAQRAGIQSRSLFDKMKRLGLRKEDFRSSGTSQSAKKTS
jgi:DNA-binding NtrC family response regulator